MNARTSNPQSSRRRAFNVPGHLIATAHIATVMALGGPQNDAVAGGRKLSLSYLIDAAITVGSWVVRRHRPVVALRRSWRSKAARPELPR